MNLNGLDLNLLPPLKALLTRRNVTLAAADAGLSQPAMSRVLARLRDVLQDPLLVRVPGGYALTSQGQSLLPKVSAALDEVSAVFRQTKFDPAQEQRTIRIVGSDAQTILLAPALMARLSVQAPGIDVRFEPYGADTMTKMQNGMADFTFALPSVMLPPGAMSEKIAADRYALVMRRSHPASQRPWTLQDYALYDSVNIGILGDGQSWIDAVLATQGVARRIALTTPHFMATLACVAQTDFIATISQTFARRFAAHFDLEVREAPLPQPDMEILLVWAHIRGNDPVLRWFRGLIGDVAAEVYGAT